MVETRAEALRKEENALTRTTRLFLVTSKTSERTAVRREMRLGQGRGGNLAVPSASLDPSLVNPEPTAGGVSSTAPAKGSLCLMRSKQNSERGQWSLGGNGGHRLPSRVICH